VSSRTGVWVSVVLTACVVGSCDEQCSRHEECAGSRAAAEAGRCFPKEVFCAAGACGAGCRKICQTVAADQDACSDGLICNDAATKREVSYCTGFPIACASVDECPLFRPADSGGIQYEWSCDQGTCRYPGFRYRFQ